MSIACASFATLANVYVIRMVQTIDKTRRERLELLIEEFGSIANLNVVMNMDRTDATFSQIRNQAVHSKTGKPRSMGDELARRIEEVLGKALGWMDTPIGMGFENEHLQRLCHAAQQLEEFQIDQLAEIAATLGRAPESVGKIPKEDAKTATYTRPPPSGVRAGLTPVRGVIAKQIGKGHFGPAADEAAGDSGERSKDRGVSGKGHAVRRR